MTEEEYIERMKDPKYKALQVTKAGSGEEYIFISYRGNSWKQMTDIAYKLQEKYKLKIYFDKDFASETNVWIEQFKKNMDSPDCRALLCFFDGGYVTSYATLLELMHAMNPKSNLRDSIYAINFNVKWENAFKNEEHTGLGVEDPDNPSWELEEKTFNYEFGLLKKKYEKIEAFYDAEVEPQLRACDCANIMRILQPKNRHPFADTEEFYEQHLIEPWKEACLNVFAEDSVSVPDTETESDKEETDSETSKETGTTSGGGNPSTPIPDSGSEGLKPITGTCYHISGGKYDAYFRQNEDETFTVLKGSKIAKNWRDYSSQSIIQEAEKIVDGNGILLEDITITALSSTAKFIKGASTNGSDILSEKNLVPEEVKLDVKATPAVGDIQSPCSLFGAASTGEYGKSGKTQKMKLSEMIDRGLVSVGDVVYVKGRITDTGVLKGGDTISYAGNEYSLNQYVAKVLGPGSRNAYDYVIHERTRKLLTDLREDFIL
jgi:hypothetical protein